jgi:hypothetical protein
LLNKTICPCCYSYLCIQDYLKTSLRDEKPSYLQQINMM